MLITMFWQVSKIFRIIFPQYHLLRLLFLPPQSPQPQDHKVSEKKERKAVYYPFFIKLLFECCVFIDFVFDSISHEVDDREQTFFLKTRLRKSWRPRSFYMKS